VTRDAIVLAGGDPTEIHIRSRLPGGAIVIAADSGLHQAERLGIRVDFVVGDLDSADPDALDRAQAAGAVVERHPVDKDATDLELALDMARDRGVRRITVVGGSGGRLDHFVANIALLASPKFADLEIDAWPGEARVAVVQGGRPPHSVTGASGSLLTLLPAGGEATGITTTGLQYPLRDATLRPGTSRGVSNVLIGTHGSVVLDHGTLLAIQPFAGQPFAGLAFGGAV
jgi:thiamine pyrophosphokinase